MDLSGRLDRLTHFACSYFFFGTGLMAQRERPDLQFHGIVVEAVPRTFKWLQAVRSRNQLTNGKVEIHNAAIWSSPASLWVDR